jgi:hypothetical protein
MHDENSPAEVPTLNGTPMKVPARIPDWLGRATYLESDPAAQAIHTAAKHEDDIRQDAEIAHVQARLEGVSERLDQLNDTELDQAIGDAELVWDTYSLKAHQLRAQIEAERLRRTGGDTHDEHTHQPMQEQAAAAA